MLTLYHCVGARSFRALWMLVEQGLNYELKVLPFPPRALARDFLTINPLGTVPFLVDGETRMTESAAICHYLGTRYGPSPLVVSAEEPDYGAYLNWLHFGEATLTFPQTIVLRYSRLEPEERRNPQVVNDYKRWFLGRLKAVELAVAQTETLCGNRFTAADISVGYALRLATYIGLDAELNPGIRSYYDRLQERPAYKKAVAVENAAREVPNS